ncbi:hypothetical protein HPB52_012246 [Rhipicephalus sanguineus]|uniref:Mutator-like transposase domain-containing protein n=1 Tax=Rhipicephalus sanguineus TaxID=34632 RepID=A0A9D4T038_RHISA|nr:hypothetical protein HPB52_012246 [Rhipicephalus sanguineus]
MLCNGDIRSYSAVNEAKVYSFINVEKEDCANHVQKHAGTALRNLVQKHEAESGERISGKGRLTVDGINNAAQLLPPHGICVEWRVGHLGRGDSIVDQVSGSEQLIDDLHIRSVEIPSNVSFSEFVEVNSKIELCAGLTDE